MSTNPVLEYVFLSWELFYIHSYQSGVTLSNGNHYQSLHRRCCPAYAKEVCMSYGTTLIDPLSMKDWSETCHRMIDKIRSIGKINTLRPKQNGCHLPDNIFKCIFLNENVWILIKISLEFVPKGPINNIPALVQIMAWCRPGDKPLSEPMMVDLLMHICIT